MVLWHCISYNLFDDTNYNLFFPLDSVNLRLLLLQHLLSCRQSDHQTHSRCQNFKPISCWAQFFFNIQVPFLPPKKVTPRSQKKTTFRTAKWPKYLQMLLTISTDILYIDPTCFPGKKNMVFGTIRMGNRSIERRPSSLGRC